MPQLLASTYEVLETIGKGGGGEVYRGYHTRLEKEVVIKRDLNPRNLPPEMLRREVDALKKLSHTYIPQVYDFVEEEGVVYTVMDYIKGESLDKPLQRGERFPQAQVIEWACELLEALSYLHHYPPHGILHSDIKPANIMVTPQGDIRLIDFNIALAMGADGAVRVGRSMGYASPEHYGEDFAGSGLTQRNGTQRTGTQRTASRRAPSSRVSTSTADGNIIMLDVRSDIYGLGATLYHLLTGKRPAQRAVDVLPVSTFTDRNISPALAAIVEKAMAPDPELRYQSADEMLTAFRRLHRDDPRARHRRRAMLASFAAVFALLLLGGALTYVGLRRMERSQNAIALAERSARALKNGDVLGAVTLALDALPERGPLDPPENTNAQRALANALGVYDLDAGYKAYASLPLPAAPVNAGLSPDGRYTVALADNRFFVFDTESGRQIAALPAEPSPLSGYAFRDPDTLLYAGTDGLTAYNIPENRTLWANGRPATAVTLSADRGTAATVYKDAAEALICDAYSGEVRRTISFDGRHQRVAVADTFSRSTGVLLTLDAGGNWLAASFDDGSLSLFGIESGEALPIVPASEYAVFEGGFSRSLFAVAANRTDGSSSLTIFNMFTRDTVEATNTIPMHVQTDNVGVCLSHETSLTRLDPETFQETQVAYYPAADITAYLRAGDLTLIRAADNACLLYDRNALQIADFTRETAIDFAAVAGDYVLLADRDTPAVQLLRSDKHSDAYLFSYDSAYPHIEAHVLADRSSAMLISPAGFRIIRPDGSTSREKELPDMEQMYKVEYKRENGGEFLDCTYNDGAVRRYAADTGELLSTDFGPVPDPERYQLFETDDYRVEFAYRETPEIRRRSNGKLIRALELDGNVMEADQIDDKLMIQYVSTDLKNHAAVLVDADGQILADLPDLCDILPDRTLIFDDQLGNLRRGRLYTLAQLRTLGRDYKEARQ
ncbi:MAG: serine/threonine protein kinase [Oscillibacter sp.]|nr:serine/threonine protein kinase [Oscillibacter sp.]